MAFDPDVQAIIQKYNLNAKSTTGYGTFAIVSKDGVFQYLDEKSLSYKKALQNLVKDRRFINGNQTLTEAGEALRKLLNEKIAKQDKRSVSFSFS